MLNICSSSWSRQRTKHYLKWTLRTERDRATLSPTTRSNEMWSRIVETGLEADTGASLPLAHLLGGSVVTERLDLDRIWELTGWLVRLSP